MRLSSNFYNSFIYKNLKRKKLSNRSIYKIISYFPYYEQYMYGIRGFEKLVFNIPFKNVEKINKSNIIFNIIESKETKYNDSINRLQNKIIKLNIKLDKINNLKEKKIQKYLEYLIFIKKYKILSKKRYNIYLNPEYLSNKNKYESWFSRNNLKKNYITINYELMGYMKRDFHSPSRIETNISDYEIIGKTKEDKGIVSLFYEKGININTVVPTNNIITGKLFDVNYFIKKGNIISPIKSKLYDSTCVYFEGKYSLEGILIYHEDLLE